VKNRFGASGEVAVFEMDGRGLSEVTNPSKLLLRGRSQNEPGSVVAPVIIGTRPFLVEVQALTVPAPHGNPRRVVTGLDPRRAQLVLAILERRGGFDLAARDVYLNVIGGIRVDEPAADICLALALASALVETPVPNDCVAIGELGLMGEVRAVPRLDQRLSEAARLGFSKALLPADAAGGIGGRIPGLEARAVSTLTQALEVVGVVA
jgi:DNA repair protein RadA/Sms